MAAEHRGHAAREGGTASARAPRAGGRGRAGLLPLSLPSPSSPQPGATAPLSLHAAPLPPPFSHLAGGTPGGPAPLRQPGGHFPSRRRKRREARGEKQKSPGGARGAAAAAAAESSLPLWAGKRQPRAQRPSAILVSGTRPQARWWLAAGRPRQAVCLPHARGLRVPPAGAPAAPAPPRLKAVSLYALVPQRAERVQGPAGRCLVTCGARCASTHRSRTAGAVCGARPGAGSGSDPAALGDGGAAALYCSTFCSRQAGGRPSLGCDTAAPRSGRAPPRGFSSATKLWPRSASEQPLTGPRSGVCPLAKCYNSRNHRVF